MARGFSVPESRQATRVLASMSCTSPRHIVCLKLIVAPLRRRKFGGDDNFIIEHRGPQKIDGDAHHRELQLPLGAQPQLIDRRAPAAIRSGSAP